MIPKERLISNIFVALESVASNKVRSVLTALGIIFGVAAVITMLAIGKGAEKEIMSQMELVGVNNIIINSTQSSSIKNKSSDAINPSAQQKRISTGLSLADAENILKTIPGVENVSPEIIIDSKVISHGIINSTKLIGITNDFFNVFDFQFKQGGSFTKEQLEKGLPVCIIGNEIKNKFIRTEKSIGQKIKCNDQWLTVVGVLDAKEISSEAKKQEELGIRNYNQDIYIPIQTMLIRYQNRSLINQEIIFRQRMSPPDQPPPNYHQLDKITVKVASGFELTEISSIISRMLLRRHLEFADYTIIIPEQLLRQQQKAKRVFSIVLAVIAGISLLVGGIGIMNIMLASVLERIREIGLRIALGAKQIDIIQQFLFESVIIGVVGGIIGILFGSLLTVLIQYFTGIETVISPLSIVLAFIVAVGIGLFFGLAPAKRAAKQDPISSLRHE